MNRTDGRRVVIKCAFGGKDGWGHLIRSSVLATVFKARGWETALWSDGDLREAPSEVADAFDKMTDGHGAPAEVLVVDEMYTSQQELEELGQAWRRRNPLSIYAGIDDMQRRSMAGFDLAINAEVGLNASRYEAATVMLGERYALVRKHFSNTELPDRSFSNSVSAPIFIMFGGTDAFDYLQKALSRLLAMRTLSFSPVVVTGSKRVSEELLCDFAEYRLLNRCPAKEIAQWMRACRCGIVACGSSLYEAAVSNLPFVGISLVDNQMAMAKQVAKLWKMPVLHCEEESGALVGLEDAVLTVLEKGKEAYSEVDTNGAERIADGLEVLLAERRSQR